VRATSNSSMSKENSSKSCDGAGGRLTYKDAGVDIDAGSELIRRIAKMAPGIGGLFPLGMLFAGFFCFISCSPLLVVNTIELLKIF